MPGLKAITGTTLIDGNGGVPIDNATVLVRNDRIEAVGAGLELPSDVESIDGRGKFLVPGFVDTNVHVSLYGASVSKARKETAVLYWHRGAEISLEGAQMHLKHGVTHIRDSYGQLPALTKTRDAIASGTEIGPRMQVAGNIVGWGGAFSITFALVPDRDLSVWEEQFSDEIAQGAGEELMDMYPDELRVAINDYLDKGVDFVKYGGTSHWLFPTMISFSPEAQQIIVDETHARGLVAETHSTSPEGLRLSIEAGIDLIQHPEFIADRPLSDGLVESIRERQIVCSMLVSSMTGPAWDQHLELRDAAKDRHAKERSEATRWSALRREHERADTSFEKRRRNQELGRHIAMRRENGEKLVEAGCLVTVGTDNYTAADPQFARQPKPIWQEPGIGTLMAIEGLVELGMSPSDAIVAGTKNGAIAARGLDEFGTIEVGKSADLVLLAADPLKDITNIRRQSMVMARGRKIDVDALPTAPVMFRN